MVSEQYHPLTCFVITPFQLLSFQNFRTSISHLSFHVISSATLSGSHPSGASSLPFFQLHFMPHFCSDGVVSVCSLLVTELFHHALMSPMTFLAFKPPSASTPSDRPLPRIAPPWSSNAPPHDAPSSQLSIHVPLSSRTWVCPTVSFVVGLALVSSV